MSKISNFSIVASFLGLWINSFFGENVQIFIGFVVIFSFGILHGSNDLLLIDKTQSKINTNSFYKILLYYTIVVGSGLLLFYFIPAFALLLFIVVSGYHFGEQHWQTDFVDNHKKITLLFQLSYGLLILSLLFIFHVAEVQEIIFEISKVAIPTESIAIFFYISLGSFLLLSLFKYFTTKEFKKRIFQEILFLFVFAIIFKTSSLIWGFAIYFILWHSIPSMSDQINFLYGSVSFSNFKKYFKSAFFYWIVSLIGILILSLIFREDYFFNALFFSFLAAITFPHVWVIVNMFKIKKPN
jgi:Brp/Blh family beta-carotene 15,15'-monooxygenase